MRNVLIATLLLLSTSAAVGDDVEYGIAAKYPNDRSIAADAEVIFFEGYEHDKLDDLRALGWNWNKDWSGDTWSLSTDPKLAFAGRKCIVRRTEKGRTGSIMPRDLAAPETDAVYHRVYLKVPKDLPNTRVMGITGVREGWKTWRAIGSAGWKPSGDNYYCVTLTFRNNGKRIVPSWYPYHVDQKAQWGSNWRVDAEIPTDRWFCLEIMVKLNTTGKVPGSEDHWRNGELRMWIDGREVYTRTDITYRTDPTVKTRMVFDQCYSSQKYKSDGTWYADNRVVARKYIGPMVTEKRAPTHPSLTGKPQELPPKQQAEKTGPGLASKHPGDAGLAKDPDVIFVEDFEVDDLDALAARGWTPRWGPGRWTNGSQEKTGWKYVEIEEAPGAAFAGSRCFLKHLEKGAKGSRMIRDLPEGEEVVYVRGYLKIPAKMPPHADYALRLLGVTGVKDGMPTWQTYGAQTPRSKGDGPFWLDLTFVNFERRGKVLSRKLVVQSQNTDDLWEVTGSDMKIPVDKWFAIEMKVKLNAPDKRDGEIRVWIDGREVFTHTQAWFRSTDAVKIRSIHDQVRCDTHHKIPADYAFREDSLVVARKYIGPMKAK